jgi:hypothetical protein
MDNCSSVSSDHSIGVSTGNWGCGAFGGNPEIKSMIQWIAASQVHVITQSNFRVTSIGELFLFPTRSPY